ncbi:amino acid adenylation domain-containing protein [Streptomyces sp. 8N706]|uniref:amino acid adenylation domain-containing protein n=1 Tax=Streptomyces sp. 8N706 TaxID=3457416 RepID=UPI003FD2FD2D
MYESIYDSGRSLLDQFEARVASGPDAVALECGGKRLSYRELEARANQLAHHLGSLGVGPEDVVGVCLGRGFDAVVGLLGVLKTGGAYLPLDPGLPGKRLAHMTEDVNARVIITTSAYASRLLTGGRHILLYDQESAAIAERPATHPESVRDNRALMYVIYTSGSTGMPKGISLTWQTLRNIVRFDLHRDHYLGDDPVTCLQFASVGFDVSFLEIFATLIRGGRLVLVEDAAWQDPERLLDLLASEQVERMYLSPAMLGQLVTSWAERPVDLPLSHIFVSGDVLALTPQIRSFLSGLDGVVVENQYGPSETHHATSAFLTGDPRTWPDSPSIGRAIPGVRTYLLDDRLNLVPPGVRGELYIAGEGLARGYVNKPGLTAERFVANPFGSGERMYRTGDMARWTADGMLEFLGRTDDQVKIRGFRIEPSEIENALTAHTSVSRAAVVVREDRPSERRLTAYIVPTVPDGQIDAAALRDFLRPRLPAYMLPAAFMTMASLPLTRNGKIDRRLLPTPTGSRQLSGAYAPPSNRIEQAIAEIWEAMLKLDSAGIDDDFFELGGHSLLATQVVSRMRTTLDSAVSVRDLFEHPTIRRLAAKIKIAQMPPDEAMILPRWNEGKAELSFAQRRLWFFDQLVPGSPAYNVSIMWHVRGQVDPDVLTRALRAVCDRHEVLRTAFASSEGHPYQVVSPWAAVVLETNDMSGLERREAEDEVTRRVQQLGLREFDLTAGPLMRAQLFRIADDQYRFALHLHHIVVDSWSMRVIWKELSALYDAYAADQPTRLPPLAIQYADYAVWQHSWLDSDRAAGQLHFWTDLLKGAPESLDLPTDHPRPKALSGQGHTIDFVIPAETAEAVRRVGQAHSATPFMTFLTAFHTLLARYTGVSDIVTGSPVSGRVRPETEDLIGFFVNTMALRSTWTGDPKFSELLDRMRGITLDAQRNQDIPFERVVEELAPERDISRNPVFQIVFAYSGDDDYASPSGWEVEYINTDFGHALFDLELQLEESGDDLVGTVCYSTDLFESATMHRLIDHFVTLCAGIAADPQQTVSRLPLLECPERDRILLDWNDNGVESQLETHLLDQFEARVASGPDAVALECGGKRLSYRELEARANQLAHHLGSLGVGPEDVVGVCLGRGFDAVVGLLGVLKTGGAYLPLDPGLPGKRLAHMTEDVNARVIITTSAYASRLLTGGRHILLYDQESAAIAERPATHPESVRDNRALMYVIYTSGSTGMPKGIGVSWRTMHNVVRFDLHRQRTWEVAPQSCLQLASQGFDVSLQEIFVTLLNGGRLVLVEEDARHDTDRLLELLAGKHAERMYLSPTQLDQLAISWSDQRTEMALSHVSVGGEPLRLGTETVELLSGLDGVVVENQYGPSETHHATSAFLTGDPRTWPVSPSIGRAIPGVRTYLLDDRLNLVPPGVRGELYIAGEGVARGYVNKPGLTAERFVANPFGSGERMYRTGDMARWTADGMLEFLGRTDDQVKIRGFRIEPSEIENALTAHTSVSRAAVVVREDRPRERRLVAYVVPATQDGIDLAVLRGHLSRLLPDYMVPTTCVLIDKLPINANGKVDVRALPRPRPDETGQQLPRTLRESLLCEMFAEVLDVSEVGVHHSFFDLGGHSLLAPRLISRIRSALGVELPIRRLFDAPTVAGLAAALAEHGKGQSATSGLGTLFPLRTAGTGEPLFCIHPAAGISWCYAGLPRLIGRGTPVYGLQDPGLFDAAQLPACIEDMAAHYIGRIREVQPHGPYYLLGWSFGGLVAHEAAVQLQRQGEDIGLLCVLDGYPAEGTPNSGRFALNSSGNPDDRTGELRRYAGVSVELDKEETAAVHRSMVNNVRLMEKFEPKLFQGNLTFVTATQGRDEDAPVWESWLPFVTGTVTDHPVDCAHLGMMRPEPLAAIASILLKDARLRDRK